MVIVMIPSGLIGRSDRRRKTNDQDKHLKVRSELLVISHNNVVYIEVDVLKMSQLNGWILHYSFIPIFVSHFDSSQLKTNWLH